MTGTRAHLQIWFEFASTYSYLTVSRAEPMLRRAGLSYSWHPFLLGPIFRDRGMTTSPFVLDPLRGAYMWRDMERLCARHDLPFRRPDIFPANGLGAARIMTAALDQPWSGDFARAVFAAQFARGEDISQPDVLRRALTTCNVDPDPWRDKAQLPDTKDRLRAATQTARTLGIFGAPSLVVNTELFWGDDRLEDAIAFALTQNSPTPEA